MADRAFSLRKPSPVQAEALATSLSLAIVPGTLAALFSRSASPAVTEAEARRLLKSRKARLILIRAFIDHVMDLPDDIDDDNPPPPPTPDGAPA